MSFQKTVTYPVGVERAMDHFASAEMTKARYEARGEKQVEVLEAGRTDTGAKIVTRRVAEIDVPSIAKKVMSPTNTLVQTDVWTGPNSDGGYDGVWELEVKGAPVSTNGTMTLAPKGDDEVVYTVTGTIEVKVPMVGKKIGQFLEGSGQEMVEKEMAWNRGELG